MVTILVGNGSRLVSESCYERGFKGREREREIERSVELFVTRSVRKTYELSCSME